MHALFATANWLSARRGHRWSESVAGSNAVLGAVRSERSQRTVERCSSRAFRSVGSLVNWLGRIPPTNQVGEMGIGTQRQSEALRFQGEKLGRSVAPPSFGVAGSLAASPHRN